ncbi:hypothetical protein HQO24_10365 [Rhodococcus fascians]|nr:hypothetical protein [Rhodococcus fascians]MBY4396916.1 hypothetical protein [Rhodococcus fascians]MBY4407395.1 hypothetical protein [Rhodococcus fascians]MBY4421476.1 hypothetical protein [Rhodococcus fascians]MBY4460771.1 hypothetical protein [Rhodococcus fascians]
MSASDMDDFVDAINDPQLDMQVGAAEDGRALSEDEWAAIERFRAGEPLHRWWQR